MDTYSYSKPNYTFGQTIVTLRTALGMTQAELAQFLHVSRRTIGGWEAGSSYPKVEHFKVFIELCVKKQTFPIGREAEQIRTLWKAAHLKVLVDEHWLSTLLTQQHPPLILPPEPTVKTKSAKLPLAQTEPESHTDWGEAPAVPTFYGRKQELARCMQWVVQERCRLVSLLGMGGIGKSALAVNAMYQVANHFKRVIFRSLRDAPSCETLLDDCLQVLAPQPLRTIPGTLERRISLLLEYLRTSRTLLVLDNMETLLEEGNVTGRLRAGFEGYGWLLRQVAETAHQSCLLLTSREEPMELRLLAGKHLPVHSLRLSGLDIAACEALLEGNEVIGTRQDWAHLAQAYAGNPLALKIVAQTIGDLFGGEISQFFSTGTAIFGNITNLLAEHFTRLSVMEQTVLYWLAIVREPATIEEILALLVTPLPRAQLLETIDSLRRRCLIERGQRPGSFTLQSVVLEYVSTLLTREAVHEIQQQKLHHLIQYGLEQAGAREHVRQTQERLLVLPILTALQNTYQRRNEVEDVLHSLLDKLRQQADDAQGYGPANLITLLRLHSGQLRNVDLSQLVIRAAYLRGVEMQDASLAATQIRDTAFTEALYATAAVAISRDGKYWAASNWQGEVRIWVEDGQTLYRVWQAHSDIVWVLDFSPDGRTLATGSWDGTFKRWDLQTGALLWTGRQNAAQCLAFSPDGSLFASGGLDATLRLWDSHSGAQVQALQHSGFVIAVAWSPDGRLLAGGCVDGSIHVWAIQKTQPATCIKIISAHSKWVMGLAFAPDDSTLASASGDATVKLWDVASGHLLQTLSAHTDHVNSVVWSPDGQTVASCGFDNMIWLWDVEHGRYRAALHGHSAYVYGVAFTPDSRHLLSGSQDGTMRVWDVASGQCVHIIQGYSISFYDIAWNPDGTQLVSGDTDKLAIIWDVAAGSPLTMLRGHHWIVGGVGWSPDGQWLVTNAWDDTIRLWNPGSGACIQVLQNPGSVLLSLELSPDGHLLACGTYTLGVHVWDVSALQRRWSGISHMTAFRRVTWRPDGSQLAGGGDDGNICLWDAADGTLLRLIPGHQGMIMSVAWSPDGTLLASAGGGRGSSGELFLWDVQHWERVKTLEGHAGVVSALVWDSSGNLLVSGDRDGELRWWDVHSGECIKTRAAHKGLVRSLRRSPNDRRLASCGDDGAIMLWDLHNAEHQQTLRRERPYERLNITAIRGLTEAQKSTLRSLGAIEDEIPL